jgi:hypothetical protein
MKGRYEKIFRILGRTHARNRYHNNNSKYQHTCRTDRHHAMHTSKMMIRVLLQIISVLLWQEHVCPFILSRQASGLRNNQSNLLRALSWSDLESQFGSAYEAPLPISIDSVLQPEKPSFSTERPTLFRERHGWCPCM